VLSNPLTDQIAIDRNAPTTRLAGQRQRARIKTAAWLVIARPRSDPNTAWAACIPRIIPGARFPRRTEYFLARAGACLGVPFGVEQRSCCGKRRDWQQCQRPITSRFHRGSPVGGNSSVSVRGRNAPTCLFARELNPFRSPAQNGKSAPPARGRPRIRATPVEG